MEETGFFSEEETVEETENSIFIENIGHSAAAMYDLQIMRRKTQHCLFEVYDNVRNDRPEFGNVAAYTCALLASKCLLGQLGIFLLSSRGKSYFFDFMPQFGTNKAEQFYNKKTKNMNWPLKVIKLGKKQISHSDIWTLLTTLSGKRPLTENDDINSWARDFRYDRQGLVRNRILYDSSYWPSRNPSIEEGFDDYMNVCEFMHRVGDDHLKPYFSDYELMQRCLTLVELTRTT